MAKTKCKARRKEESKKSKKLSKKAKKSFLSSANHDEVVEDLAEKKGEEDFTQVHGVTNGDFRQQWAQSLIVNKPIKAIAKEFTQNKRVKPTDYTTEAYDRNDAKNRYNDIVCIDQTRVKLKNRPPSEDYIHASWMIMPDGQKYICTQGPLLEFVNDFWHMITSEKCNVIVMLCNFNEGKHEKCCLYIPKEKSEVSNFGGFKVSIKEYKRDPFETIRHTTLDVKWEDKEMVVHHLANFSWPDHTAPLDAAPTIGMLKLSRSLANGAPITVHCSAGIGRSATFVAIDYASQKIREKPTTSMVDVVKDLRSQRFQAIQSAIQYVFLHICLLEMFAGEGALQRDTKYHHYLDSYVSMIKRYNKRVEAKENEREKSEAQAC